MRYVTLVSTLVFALTSVSLCEADDTAKAWTYRQSSGELLFDGKVVAKGYSGHGEGLNNPEKDSVRDVGPIPRCEWSMGDTFKYETKGPR